MKKTFYCVMSEFYDDGTVNAAIISRECREKPRKKRSLPLRFRQSNHNPAGRNTRG
jgi:hypothetical protein